MSRKLQLLLSLAISGGALWYCLRDIDAWQVVDSLRDTRLGWLLPMALAAAVTMWLRGERWRVLLASGGGAANAPVFDATCIGFMGNMLLPLRAGEALRPLIVTRGGSVKLPAAIATVALDRLFDMIMLGVFVGLTLLVAPRLDALRVVAQVLMAVVAASFAALLFAVRKGDALLAFGERVVQRLPQRFAHALTDAMRSFFEGMQGLRDLRTVFAALAWSAAIWTGNAVGYVVGVLALDLPVPLLAAGLACNVIIAAAVSVPSAPGFIGVFQAGSVMALGLFGVPEATAFSFGMLTWVVQMLVIVALGMLSLSRLDLSLRDMAEVSAAVASPAAAISTPATPAGPH